MNRLFGSILFATLLMPLVGRTTDADWINNGTITVAPNIDATNVINTGSISIFTSLPFDTSNTKNLTNSGGMNGTVGFRFDDAPRNSSGTLIGARRASANFHNKSTGTVSGSNYLLVNSTNIYNQGTLSVGVNGLMQLLGTNVNIARSGLAVGSIVANGSVNGETNFTPSTAIYDSYWGQTNDTFGVATIAVKGTLGANAVTIVNTPSHQVTFGGPYFSTQLGFTIPIDTNHYKFVAAYTSAPNETNEYRQAVFVKIASTNMGVRVRFGPSSSSTNFFKSVGVEISEVQSNVVSSTSETNFIYFSDTLASTTNRGILTNTRDGTGRPANYIVSRLPVAAFTGGVTNNTASTNSILYASKYDSTTSFGDYAGYSCTVDNLASSPPFGEITNNPGRVEIRAGNLDMNKARIRTEGLLTIQATHLISSSNAVVDSENLSYNLGSTNGTLRLQNLMKASVNRFRGDINAWSAVWTNSYTTITSIATNVVSVNLHALVLDAQILQDTFPVFVYELTAKATNVIMSDNAVVGRKLLLDCETFTLDSALTLSGSIQNWSLATSPILKRFTNNGSLTIPSEANFGTEGPMPYLSFVNAGFIQSYGQNIRSDYALLSGFSIVSAAFSLNSLNGQIDGGQIFAGGLVTLAGSSIRLNQAFVSSHGSLLINVTNSLFDDGAASANQIDVRDGFFMSSKPATGDLLGTAVFSDAATFAQVNHVWAGRNDGVSNSGYTNNVALGSLTLTPLGSDPLFVFSGTGAVGVTNGLYVDLLDLSHTNLTDYANQLQIDPNLVIYYALATVNFTPPGGKSASEYLDGQFGGHLRWVKSFSGPNSTTSVTINGNQVISVNTALRTSMTLDTDADGVVNGLDASPFDGVTITSIQRNTSPAGYKLTWNASPGTQYRVEVKTNLISPVWSLQFNTTSTNAVVAPWTVVDTNATPPGVTRYYRVTYGVN